MALIVQKFGGTSVGNIERIKHVASRIKQWCDKGHKMVIVVSAMSGETNRLTDLTRGLNSQPNRREMDVVLSSGEQVSMGLLCMALHSIGQDAVSFTGLQAGIKTDNAYTKARIKHISPERIFDALESGKVAVVAGFQGCNAKGDITTLGRGGSDTSAVALASALNADECQIYTDVDGVFTTDPRVEPKARPMKQLTFEEMLEMASLGAKVLQIRSVEFAYKYNIPIRVLSSLKDEINFEDIGGTLIHADMEEVMEEPVISGIAFSRDEAKITIMGVPDQPGVASDILGAIADKNIEVDMIIQNIAPDGMSTDFTFTVHRNDCSEARIIVEQIAHDLGARGVDSTNDIVKLSLVGVGMRSHAGVAGKMFKVLAKESINIQLISTSEIKISVVIAESMLEKAVKALHEAFDLDKD